MRICTLAIALTATATATAAVVGFSAHAQESAPTPKPTEEAPPPHTTPPATTPTPAAEGAARPSSAVVGGKLEAGARVEDAAGGEIGVISSVSGTSVTLTVDGASYTVPASSLSTTSGVIVSRSTKAQIVGKPN